MGTCKVRSGSCLSGTWGRKVRGRHPSENGTDSREKVGRTRATQECCLVQCALSTGLVTAGHSNQHTDRRYQRHDFSG